MAKANALALPKAMAMPRAKAMPRTWLGLWLRFVILQWLAAGPSGAGRRDAMSGTRKAKQGHHQDNVHETNVFELHFENQHFFVCISVDEVVFEKAPWVVGSHPLSNSQSGDQSIIGGQRQKNEKQDGSRIT